MQCSLQTKLGGDQEDRRSRRMPHENVSFFLPYPPSLVNADHSSITKHRPQHQSVPIFHLLRTTATPEQSAHRVWSIAGRMGCTGQDGKFARLRTRGTEKEIGTSTGRSARHSKDHHPFQSVGGRDDCISDADGSAGKETVVTNNDTVRGKE